MKKQSIKNTALYCRVASGGQCAWEAIEAQRSNLIQHAENLSLKNIRAFSDCGYSGLNFNRPAFQEMLLEIEAGRVETLVVSGIDRLTRSAYDQIYLFDELLPQHGVVLRSIKDMPYVPPKTFLASILRAQEKGAWA